MKMTKTFLLLFFAVMAASVYGQTYPGTPVSNPVRTYTQNDTKGVWVIGNGAPIFSPTAKMSQLYFDYMNQTGYFWNGSAWVAWTNDFLRTASNGLTEDGTDVKLGGTLTEPTTIDLDGNDFIIQGAGTMGFDIIGDIALISTGGVEIRPDGKFEVHTLGNIDIDATQDIVIVTDDVINIQAVNGGSIIADNNDFVLEATAGDVQINSPGTTAGVVNGIAYKSDIANSVAVTDYGVNITTAGVPDNGKVWTYNSTSNEMELVSPGDITPYTATAPITLTGHDIGHTASGVTPATYGSQTAAAVVTVDATGHVTGATTTTIIPDVNTIGANQLTSGLRDSITLNNWNLLGNTGTLQATNFLGTTDAIGLSLRTNNVIRQTIRSDGNVGIGTIDPQVELQVVSTSSNNPRGIMTSQFSSNLLGSRLHFWKARGTVLSPTTVVTADTIGSVRFSGYDGSNYLQMGSIDLVSSGTIAANRIPTYMAFSTATNAATSVLTERMRINSEGNIGIGITNPAAKVSIGNDGGYNGNLFVASTARIANIGGFEFVNNGSASYSGQGISLVSANRMIEFIGSNSITADDFVFKFRTSTGIFSNPTSGAKTFLEIAGGNTSFSPTSGTASYNTLVLSGVINQTGGANGITRGLYVNPTLTAATDYRAIEVTGGTINVTKTITTPGTTGNQTINKLAGTVNIAAAGTTVTVTNSLVNANSIIMATIETNDATAVLKNVVPGAGSFVINLTAAATAETAVSFFVIN
jgi:hypothetical protein